jgi:hypothetical protein
MAAVEEWYDDDPTEGGADEAGDEGVEAQDEGAPEGAPDEGEAAPDSQAPTQEALDLHRRITELESALRSRPLAADAQGQEQTWGAPQISQPPKPLSECKTVEDLEAYLDWKQQSRTEMAQAQYRMEAAQIARLENSEQHARGLFAGLGQDNNYDAMKARYLDPHMARNPNIARLLAESEKPAVATYFLALMHRVVSAYGNDPVKGARAILNAIGAEARGAQGAVRSITEAARRGAAKVLRPGAGGQVSEVGQLSPKQWLNMTDEEFDRHDRRITRGRSY